MIRLGKCASIAIANFVRFCQLTVYGIWSLRVKVNLNIDTAKIVISSYFSVSLLIGFSCTAVVIRSIRLCDAMLESNEQTPWRWSTVEKFECKQKNNELYWLEPSKCANECFALFSNELSWDINIEIDVAAIQSTPRSMYYMFTTRNLEYHYHFWHLHNEDRLRLTRQWIFREEKPGAQKVIKQNPVVFE